MAALERMTDGREAASIIATGEVRGYTANGLSWPACLFFRRVLPSSIGLGSCEERVPRSMHVVQVARPSRDAAPRRPAA